MTLYAIRPLRLDAEPDEEEEVVDQLKEGWQFLEQAIALWRLVDEPRAEKLEAIRNRVTLADPEGEPRFEPPDIVEIVKLLTGIAEALVAAGVVDTDWCVTPERAEALGRRVPGMDLRSDRSSPELAQALAEVMNNAISIRNFFADAAQQGCAVVLARAMAPAGQPIDPPILPGIVACLRRTSLMASQIDGCSRRSADFSWTFVEEE